MAKPVKIGNRHVGPGHPCFIVAEIGINHNGSLKLAMDLIDAAADAGADAVKFQKRDVRTVYTEAELAAPRQVDASIIRHAMERMELEGIRNPVLPDENVRRLKQDAAQTTNGDLKYALEFGLKEFDLLDLHCQEKGIPWFASAWDGLSAHFLNGFDVPCHKIASACLTHRNLLERVRKNGKPVILSTGGSTIEQVEKAVRILGREDLVILHCVAAYPCADEDINLEVMNTLSRMFPDVPVGYSGHEAGIEPSLAAAAMGACMIERHITLDTSMPGSDQKASLDPGDFARMVKAIRRFEKVRGDGIKRLLPSEVPVMKKLRRKDTLDAPPRATLQAVPNASGKRP